MADKNDKNFKMEKAKPKLVIRLTDRLQFLGLFAKILEKAHQKIFASQNSP